MAWRSGGTNNDEMVNNLKRFGVISSTAVEEAFRQVDRAHFVPQNQKNVAHTDQPLRDGNIHISAPHIYGSVLEALELQPQSSLSFLNVGAGTGYMSCIVATILGLQSNNYGVEIHADVVQHAKTSMQRWKDSRSEATPQIEWIHGNALSIDSTHGEAVVGFDRIYVGASVEKEKLHKLTCLLRPGGILVGPVDDELVKVVRIGPRNRIGASSTRRSTDMETDSGHPPSSDFSQQVLSGVRFASLVHYPELPTVLPSKVWNPSIHHCYPDSFRKSCREILLCSNAPRHQATAAQSKETVNHAGMLPRVLWMEILSYTHRDWFEPPETEEQFLRRRLLEEQEYAQRAHQARREAEARCVVAEEERDVYRVLARRYQMRLERLEEVLNHRRSRNRNGRSNASNEEQGEEEENDDDVEEAAAAVLSGREQAVVFGLGAMLRSFRYEDASDDDDDDGIDEEEVDFDEEEGVVDEAHDDESLADEDEVMEDHESEDQRIETAHARYFEGAENMVMSHPSAMVVVSKSRTVSISGEDL